MTTLSALCADNGYRWRDDVTETMNSIELASFLQAEVLQMEEQEEWDSAYAIYRELIWRFPRNVEAWVGLHRVANQLGISEQVELALKRIQELKL